MGRGSRAPWRGSSDSSLGVEPEISTLGSSNAALIQLRASNKNYVEHAVFQTQGIICSIPKQVFQNKAYYAMFRPRTNKAYPEYRIICLVPGCVLQNFWKLNCTTQRALRLQPALEARRTLHLSAFCFPTFGRPFGNLKLPEFRRLPGSFAPATLRARCAFSGTIRALRNSNTCCASPNPRAQLEANYSG